jgi:dTMP kinase
MVGRAARGMVFVPSLLLYDATRMTPASASQDLSHLKGKFVVLDGSEGSGKSTQIKLLTQALESSGIPVLSVRDPGTTAIGEQIRAILLNPAHGEMNMRCEMLLYMAARAQMMAERILPALEEGKVVVCDRFISSTLAYQLGGDGLTAEEIRAIGDVAIKGRWPDVTIILDMPVEKSMARVRREKDRIEQRPMAYFERVRENYLEQARREPGQYRVISADQPIDRVRAAIRGELAQPG